MVLPIVVAFVAISGGTWLALGPREGAGSNVVIRVVALVSALLVIATHLLPEAFHDLGPVAIAWLAAGVALPVVAHAGMSRALGRAAGQGNGGGVAALELSYIGLVVHRFGDGLSMGAAGRATASTWAELLVLVALAAHIVPVTTVMILAIRDLRGRSAAFGRGIGLLGATLAGIVAVGVLGAGSEEPLPWVSALVAGLLLHVVAHDLPLRSLRSLPSLRK